MTRIFPVIALFCTVCVGADNTNDSFWINLTLPKINGVGCLTENFKVNKSSHADKVIETLQKLENNSFESEHLVFQLVHAATANYLWISNAQVDPINKSATFWENKHQPSEVEVCCSIVTNNVNISRRFTLNVQPNIPHHSFKFKEPDNSRAPCNPCETLTKQSSEAGDTSAAAQSAEAGVTSTAPRSEAADTSTTPQSEPEDTPTAPQSEAGDTSAVSDDAESTSTPSSSGSTSTPNTTEGQSPHRPDRTISLHKPDNVIAIGLIVLTFMYASCAWIANYML